MAQEESKTTYLLEMDDGGKKKVTVPANWKVTFGALVPGSKDGRYNGGGGIALRFYEGSDKGKQHAVFVGVKSFRNLDNIGILEEIVETKREVMHRQGDDSGEQFVAEASVKTWVNPDAPKATPSAFGPAGTGNKQLIIIQK